LRTPQTELLGDDGLNVFGRQHDQTSGEDQPERKAASGKGGRS
jgi:hypothetical protein